MLRASQAKLNEPPLYLDISDLSDISEHDQIRLLEY